MGGWGWTGWGEEEQPRVSIHHGCTWMDTDDDLVVQPIDPCCPEPAEGQLPPITHWL